VYFIPTSHPPHKQPSELSPYAHRFAMVALACAEHPRFVPSLAEGESNGARRRVFYSVDTVRHFRRKFSKPGDHLYFILGADSFLQIETWKDYASLLELCDFVVASRPGFRSDVLRKVIPPKLLKRSAAEAANVIALRRTTVYVLDTVASRVSATGVRRRIDRGQSIHGLVPSSVEAYIKKQAWYL
jgi:nicotinate-nucleotide adenylyltransferase